MKVRVLPTINNEVEIIMPQELQTKDFADEYLAIQNLCNKSYSKIRVIFENTMWIDNLAIIHLFLYLKRLEQLKKEIVFEFYVDSDVTEQVRFVKYMKDYGFIKMAEKLSGSYECQMLPRWDSGYGYKNMTKGDFENSECLMPFQIITKREDIAVYISKVTQRFCDNFAGHFSDYEKESFVFRMSVFLQETLGNVFEHAFEKEADAFCGVMIRYIHRNDIRSTYSKKRHYIGLKSNENTSRPFKANSFTFKQYHQLAKDHNPYRHAVGMKVLENYMQIFVVDIGRGLLSSMNIQDAKMERNLINEVFEKGIRTDIKKRNTLVGGLGTLYQLLQKKENYISIKGEYNWARIACSKKRDRNGTLPYVHKTGVDSDNVLKGFSVIGYIDCDYECKKELFLSVSKTNVDKVYQEEYTLTDLKKIPETDVLDFRIDIPKLNQVSLKNNVILCFVGLNLEKGIWSNEIAHLLKRTQVQKRTLILVDIPVREMRKYELIFEGFELNVDKAILLTQGLELAVFVKSNGVNLCFSKEETERYARNDSHDVTKSLCALMRVIRKHDSMEFWLTVSDAQKQKEIELYINESVGWNIKESNQMDGYLDFSQACFDEKIKNFLIYQLFRLPNYGSAENYFMSMDRFTEDLCEIVNGKLEAVFEEKVTSYVRLGSVFVTGTSSKESKLDDKKEKGEEYYYFMRSLVDDCESVNALLLWPSKDIANQLFNANDESKKYMRLSKTPFVAPEGNAYFARQHYTDIKDSIDLKSDEFYSILQGESLWTNRLVKIAHVDMIDHHDYLYLNARTIFNKHFMESRHSSNYISNNSYDYLLKMMYMALGRSPRKSYAKTIEMDIQPQYAPIVKGKIQEESLPLTKGLFVYLTDYETMEIVSKMKAIFSEEIQKRIIPIAPVSKKRGTSSLLVSPVLMENIKRKLSEITEESPETEPRVTIFIASITSTRLQGELKHTLYRLGAQEIKCISLIDRQRFPLGSREKGSYSSFCKVDLPHLGAENRCGLCQGLVQLNELKGKLISKKLQERCDEIAFVWGKVRASDNLYRRGVQARRCNFSEDLREHIKIICKQYDLKNIDISTDVGLVLFSVENTAITMSIEFLMACLKDDKIDAETKILIISAHLILFGGEEIVPSDKYHLAEYLYGLLQCQKESNEYTGLACLILLLQHTRVKKKLHEYYKGNWQWSHFNNIDFIIASIGALEAADKHMQDNVLNYWLRKRQEETLNYLYGIFLLTDGEGITRHGTILSRIREEDWPVSQMDYLSADNDAAFLEVAYEHMPHSYFSNPKDYQRKRKELVDKIRGVRELLEKALQRRLEEEERKELANKTIAMLSYATYFNKELFMSSDSIELECLREKLQNLAENNKKKATCYVNEITSNLEGGVKYFCYLEDLQREISYLIRDFRHSDSRNPMLEKDGTRYEGIIDVVCEEDYMCYRFTNHVIDDFSYDDVIRRKKLKYNRPTILSLQMLFSESEEYQLFHYDYKEKENLFIVELHIPYLHV